MSSTPKNYVFLTRCVECQSVQDLDDMDEKSRPVTWATFKKHCEGAEEWAKSLGYGVHLRIQNDPYVRFWKSTFRGTPCYNLDWSCIDHIWVRKETHGIQHSSLNPQ